MFSTHHIRYDQTLYVFYQKSVPYFPYFKLMLIDVRLTKRCGVGERTKDLTRRLGCSLLVITCQPRSYYDSEVRPTRRCLFFRHYHHVQAGGSESTSYYASITYQLTILAWKCILRLVFRFSEDGNHGIKNQDSSQSELLSGAEYAAVAGSIIGSNDVIIIVYSSTMKCEHCTNIFLLQVLHLILTFAFST